jgi:hypothetical protein
MSSAQQAFFFGTGTSATSFGQPLGLSIIRVGLTDGNQDPGDCTSVSTSCAGVYVGDMQAAIANGARVFSSPWFHRQPTGPTAAQFARLLEGVAHFQAELRELRYPDRELRSKPQDSSVAFHPALSYRSRTSRINALPMMARFGRQRISTRLSNQISLQHFHLPVSRRQSSSRKGGTIPQRKASARPAQETPAATAT